MAERGAGGRFVAKGGDGADKAAAGAGKVAAATDRVTASTDKASSASRTFGSAQKSLTDSTSSYLSSLVPQNAALDAATDALKAMGPEGEAAAVVLQVLVTVATALVQVLWDLASAAVSISQEKDAMAETFAALGPAGSDGYKLVDALSEVAAALPFAEGKALAWGKSLMAANIQGKALEDGVIAIASATALMGDKGGAAAEKMIKGLAMGGAAADKMLKAVQTGGPKAAKLLTDMGLHSEDLAKALGVAPAKFATMKLTADQLGVALKKAITEKGASALENMSLTWPSIMGKLGDSFEDLFEDMGAAVKPFMKEVKALFAEFSAGGSAQSVTKSILMNFLTSLFEVAAKVVHALHTGFLTVAIAALRIAIAIAPVVNALRKLYNNASVLRGLKVLFVLLISPIIAVVTAIGFIVTGIIIAATVIGTALSFIVGAVAAAAGAIAGGIADAASAIAGWASSAYDAASNFISGLVSGIASGAGVVVAAVTALASSALSSFKATLGISSPSKVMMQMGGHMTAGLSQGLDAGSGRVQGAAAQLGGAAASGVAGGAQGGKGSGGAGISVTFADGSIRIDGAGKSGLAITQEMIASVFEMLAAQQGLAQGAT